MRILKFIGKGVIALLLLVIFFWIAAFGVLQTSTGQTWALNTIVSYLEEKTQAKIHIGTFAFSFPFHVKITDLKVTRDEKPLATIEAAETTCAFHHLPEGRLIFSSLNISGIRLFQLPESNEIEHVKSSSAITLWDKPILPFYVKIENLNIQQLHVAPELLNRLDLPQPIALLLEHSTLSLQGTVCNHPFKNAISAHLLASIHDDLSESSPLTLGIDAQNHRLSFSLHANGLPLHQLTDSSSLSSINTRLAFYATAPLISWQKLADHQTEKEDLPIEGHFKLTAEADSNHPLYSILIGSKSTFKSQFTYLPSHKIEFTELKLKVPNMTLDGSISISPEGEIHHSTFTGELIGLNQLKYWLGQTIEGELHFEGHAAGPLHSPAFHIALNSSSLTLFDRQFENLLTTIQATPQGDGLEGLLSLGFDHQHIPCQAAASLSWASKRGLTLSQLQLDALGINVQGNLTCSAPDLIWEGAVTAQTHHLEEIARLLSIPLAGNGQIKTSLMALQDSKGSNQQGFNLEFIGIDIEWSEGKASQISLHVETPSQHENRESFQIHAHLKGENIQWQDHSIETFAARGSCNANLAKRSITDLVSEWNAFSIQSNSWKANEGHGKLHMENPLELDRGGLEAALKGFYAEGIHLEEVRGTTYFDRAEAQWPFNIHASGDWKEKLQLEAEGSWHYQKDQFNIETNRLTGTLGPYALELMQPSRFEHSSEEIHLTKFHLRIAEAEFQGDFRLDHQGLFSQFKSNAIPSELFHFIDPDLPLAGRTTIQGQMEGTAAQPKGNVKIGLHHIQITEDIFAQNPLMEGMIDLQFDHQGIQLQTALHGIGKTPIAISGHLPAEISFDPFALKLKRESPFNLTVDAEGELAPYLHLFYTEAIHLAGQAKIGLKFSGTLDTPQMYGSIDLSKGSFESLNTGAVYSNIEVHLEGDGSKIALTHFNAEDTKHGTIAAQGAISLDAAQNFPYEFQIHPSQLFIIDSDYASISASGPLTLAGNRYQSKLQGTLTIDQGLIQLDETVPRRLKTVEVKYINVPEGDEQHHEIEKKKPWVVDLDVALQFPHTLAIKGKKIESEWKGLVSVKGTPDNPQLFGDLQIASGSYDLHGKIFNLTQGNIHFGGSLDKKTTLYVVASKEIDPINAEIIVKGPVNKPAISFRSNPPLSQREVLSYILFNRGISDITTDQGDQLSQSFIALNASEQSSGGNDFLSRFRNKIGIDRLDFGSCDRENKDFAMQIGKNITENIYISINQYINAAAPLFAVEVKLHKNIKAQADAGRVGDDNQFRTSIKWKKNY